ncbi:glycolate oxidase subunit GlcE [Defluviimonas sp. WL0002]|uniref:Glycolate oxidase subunit GlcE n=1 Tax=Albidovulum marisflavi TaxID=2984159 RepID=A0ABT2ZE96_9RHOB|nr:glycolate oxidase subunit GlcE [Defluviimonas sp. WL0002]MCV2869373.1 glycolate oxidase subunit GlcE [Defluviimonas sp. WL0002]
MRVSDEAELADAVRAAKGPLIVRGGGTRDIGCPVAGAVIETSGLTGIRLYEPGALTLVAGAGTPLAEIEAALASEGQRLAFEPADWSALLGSQGTPTLGGMVAANASGPRRVQAGACRDSLLGVRFVDGAGTIIKNGGRVMKNVTGYDLARLMAGSWGTLGVLSEVSLKVLPAAETSATLVLPGLTVANAVAALSAALSSPYDITGAAFLPGTGALVRVEGFAGSVAYRAGRLETLLSPHGEVHRAENGAALWRQVAEVTPFHGRDGDVWRFSLKPSEAPEVANRLGQQVMLDWGGGLLWALMPEGTDARALARPYHGHATLVRAATETRARLSVFEPEAPAVAAITKGIRARFDPRGILNPGRMG